MFVTTIKISEGMGNSMMKFIVCIQMRTTEQGRRKVWKSGGLVVMDGDNVSPLVLIGLTDLPKTGGGAKSPQSPHLRQPCRGICPFYGENKGAKPFESFNSLFSGSSRRTNWERDDVHPASFSWEIRILLPSLISNTYQFCLTLIEIEF